MLNFYIASRIRVKHTPRVLEEPEHFAVHTLRFEVPSLDVPKQSDGNEEVQKNKIDPHHIRPKKCNAQAIPPTPYRMPCLFKVLVCRAFDTVVVCTLPLPQHVHNIIVGFACGDHNQSEERVQGICKV